MNNKFINNLTFKDFVQKLIFFYLLRTFFPISAVYTTPKASAYMHP